jgi:quinoprotein relay system zinc metallohydrolase 2
LSRGPRHRFRGHLQHATLAVLASPALSAWLYAAVPNALPVAEVAPGVFVHVGKTLALDAPGHDDIANVGFVIGARCVAVIDSGGSVRVGRALRAAVRERTPLPVCYVINTHVHVDHVLGNAAFKDDKPQFIGHAQLTVALARSREFFLKNYAADFDSPPGGEQIIGPDRTVAVGSELDLDLGQRQLTLRAWPRAHTDCDLTVLDRSTATLWTGDLLFVGRTPVLDGSLKGWLAVTKELAPLPAKHVVPGHGAVNSDLAGALEPQRRYLTALLQGIRAELAQGRPLQEAVRDVQPRESQWQLWDETHPRNVARAYQELEWE